MSKPSDIELPTGEQIPILYEDRSVLAIDKPAGWMLVPVSWQKTGRNLQAALLSSIAARDFWARSRNIKFLRYVHRLDADTSGVLLLARSPGALNTLGDLFETRKVEKTYLAIISGKPDRAEWVSRAPIGPDLSRHGRMRIDNRAGKAAETRFKVLESSGGKTLVAAYPFTGRTHQVRLHLAHEGLPVLGDELYGKADMARTLALRAVALAYTDPFSRRSVRIAAPVEHFVRGHGFGVPAV